MTLDDFKLPLFTFFSTNELFDLEKNYKEITIPSLEEPKVNKAMTILALEEFEKQGLVKELPNQEQRKWVLVKDLIKYMQTVEIHFATISAIAKIINDFCEKSGDMQNKVDPLMITEKNVQDLCLLASQYTNPPNE